MRGIDAVKAATIDRRLARQKRDWTTDDAVDLWIEEDVVHETYHEMVARKYVEWTGKVNRKCRREGNYRDQKINVLEVMADGKVRHYWVILERARAEECGQVSNRQYRQRHRHDKKMKEFIDDSYSRFGVEYTKWLIFEPDDINWTPEPPNDDESEFDEDDDEGDD